MHSHPLARLTPISRERLIRRHLDEGVPLKALAAEAGIILRSAYKWLARFRSGGPSALADRRSVRRHQRRTLDPQQLQQSVDLRHQRCTLRRIARALKAPLSTVGRHDPVDTKQLARFERIGHLITGDRRQGCSPGAGYEKVHVAIDDATRLAYVEVLADVQKATVGFLARAVGWFYEQGITCRRVLSDNGPSYRSGDWRKACRALDLKPIGTKPYIPQTNGKAKRFIKTLLAEWAYVILYQTSAERNHWLPRYLGIYNDHRCHMALGGLTPQQYLQRLLIAE